MSEFIPGTNPDWGRKLPDGDLNSLVDAGGNNYDDGFNFDERDDSEEPENETVKQENEADDVSSDEYRGGALEITASDDKISILDYHKTKEAVSRCPVIRGYIYAICDNDEIEAFRLK